MKLAARFVTFPLILVLAFFVNAFASEYFAGCDPLSVTRTSMVASNAQP